jgi:hypothetical protein
MPEIVALGDITATADSWLSPLFQWSAAYALDRKRQHERDGNVFRIATDDNLLELNGHSVPVRTLPVVLRQMRSVSWRTSASVG